MCTAWQSSHDTSESLSASIYARDNLISLTDIWQASLAEEFSKYKARAFSVLKSQEVL